MDLLYLFVCFLNFFFLDRDLKKCARYHGDKHLNKMQLEYAQIASTVWWNLSKSDKKLQERFDRDIQPNIYKSSHEKHPVVLWATQSESHLLAVVELGLQLSEEKKIRAKLANADGKVWKADHASTPILEFIKANLPPIESFELADEWRDPPACMPQKYATMGIDVVESYRFYYVGHKMEVTGIKWEPYAKEPSFVKEFQSRLKIEIAKSSPIEDKQGKMDAVYKGNRKCSAKYKTGPNKGKNCDNNAYYLQDGEVWCGTHSKKDKRTELKEDPLKKLAAQKAAESREEKVVSAALENVEKDLPGRVCCSKLVMMKPAPHEEGFQSVFPNFKHEGRSDGIGLPSLSPMSLGPVEGVGKLEKALNLENWWQGQKLYTEEIDDDGNVLKCFYDRRKKMFSDEVPHRRKEGMKSDVMCFLWTDKDGREIRFKYVESRQFYCTIFERLSEKNTDLEDLRRLLTKGVNLNIVGYDGFDFNQAVGKTDADKLMSCYLDPKRPFGHELVIVCLLILKPAEYPWRKHKTADF
jgi:hypothetical protein